MCCQLAFCIGWTDCNGRTNESAQTSRHICSSECLDNLESPCLTMSLSSLRVLFISRLAVVVERARTTGLDAVCEVVCLANHKQDHEQAGEPMGRQAGGKEGGQAGRRAGCQAARWSACAHLNNRVCVAQHAVDLRVPPSCGVSLLYCLCSVCEFQSVGRVRETEGLRTPNSHYKICHYNVCSKGLYYLSQYMF